MADVKQYLLVFDRSSGELDIERLGSDVRAAARRYREVEVDHDGDANIEIVLLGSESLDSIRVTHPHYFNKERGSDSLAQLEELVREERSAS